MRSVGSHSSSGREKEGIKERAEYNEGQIEGEIKQLMNGEV